uniref:COMMD1 N-terminal domain-containing protein n=1 Tax=Neogobius melanostomus TaxID=47308 RepID=A0A8C6U8Q6_9GOBI
MADTDAAKSLSGLLNGIAQKVYHNNPEITEELTLHEKVKGLKSTSQLLKQMLIYGCISAHLTQRHEEEQSGSLKIFCHDFSQSNIDINELKLY